MLSNQKIELEPIGIVKTSTDRNGVRDRSNVSEIILNEDLIDGLDGLKDYSHIFIIFLLHEISKDEKKMKIRPRRREDMPLVGVFATRSRLHPNSIGLTLVELLKIEENILTVRGLDAFEGTPILDIKPYDLRDKIDARVPGWWLRLEGEKTKE